MFKHVQFFIRNNAVRLCEKWRIPHCYNTVNAVNCWSKQLLTTSHDDWDSGIDYVEINAREKSKQILLNHCRKKYSFPCLGASNFDQERQKSGFQRRCNAHIGPNDIENSSSSDWRRPCIDCLSWWEIWLFAMLLLISGIILDMRSKCLVGCKNGLSAA